MSSKPLIVVGASARAAAHSVIRAGMSAYAIDMFADQDLAAVCPAVTIEHYPQGFLQALAETPNATWLYTGGLENYPRLVDRLAAIRQLAGNPGAILRRVRDPRGLAAVAAEAGCPMPVQVADTRWLLKSRRGSGGTTVRFATSPEMVQPPRGNYLQPYIEGEAYGAVYVAARRRATLLGVTRQLLGRDFLLARPFLYVGSIGPLTIEPATRFTLTNLGNVLAEHFSLAGLFNVDFVSADGSIWPVEVNPRYSASVEVLERAMNLATIPLHLAACEDDQLPCAPQVPQPSHYAGKAVVYTERDGVVLELLNHLVAELNKPVAPPLLADLPRVGELVRKDQPLLTVFAESTSLAEVESLLRQRLNAVKETLRL